MVNGHAYKSKDYKTNNTNFALLVSKNFTKPFKTPIEYGKHVAQLSNMLCDGKIMVQTFGDFERGRRTTEERLCRNNLIPTLKDAVPVSYTHLDVYKRQFHGSGENGNKHASRIPSAFSRYSLYLSA